MVLVYLISLKLRVFFIMWHYCSSQTEVQLFYVLFIYSSYVTCNRSVGNYSIVKQFFK